jgi:hypothetical protein
MATQLLTMTASAPRRTGPGQVAISGAMAIIELSWMYAFKMGIGFHRAA